MRMIAITYLVAGAVSFAPAPAHADNRQNWATASDVGVAALGITALGLPLARNDRQGLYQAAGSIGTSLVVSNGLKEIFPELRPDRSDRKSFPSSHTSTAFAAAASIYNRQGMAVGIPAMAIATMVGVARVKADKHHWYDVVVGAAIGSGSGFLLTHDRRQPEIAVTPWGDTQSGGLSLAMRF